MPTQILPLEPFPPNQPSDKRENGSVVQPRSHGACGRACPFPVRCFACARASRGGRMASSQAPRPCGARARDDVEMLGVFSHCIAYGARARDAEILSACANSHRVCSNRCRCRCCRGRARARISAANPASAYLAWHARKACAAAARAAATQQRAPLDSRKAAFSSPRHFPTARRLLRQDW